MEDFGIACQVQLTPMLNFCSFIYMYFIALQSHHMIIYLLTNIVKQNGRSKSLNPLEAPGISSTGARLRRFSRNFFDRNPLMKWNWGQLLLARENTFRTSPRLRKERRSTFCVWKMQELEQIQMTDNYIKTRHEKCQLQSILNTEYILTQTSNDSKR